MSGRALGWLQPCTPLKNREFGVPGCCPRTSCNWRDLFLRQSSVHWFVSIVFLVGVLGWPRFAQSAEPSANEQVRAIVANELKAENADHSHWMFRLDTRKPNGPEEADEVVESKDGDLQRPILISGRTLSPEQQRHADAHIQYLVQHPGALRKSHHAKSEDENRSQRMLKLLPEAFLFQSGERRGDLVQFNFKPNPHFRPPDRESTVFYAMEGNIWLDVKQNRLAEMTGRLMREVKFGMGILGHLDKGGQFYVKQEEVAPGYWELTSLNVQMNGKALFFKTISVRQKYTRSDFKRLPDDLTVAQAAQLLHQQTASQQASLH